MKRTRLKSKRDTPRRKGRPLPRVGKVDGNFRSPKLLKLAAEIPCCMVCGADNDGTVVGAHPNGLGFSKGTGIKAHDLVAYMCFKCHNLYDGRELGWDSLQKQQAWDGAFYKTMLWLIQSGHLEVK